jgi:small-conductance mechanosensitive channel
MESLTGNLTAHPLFIKGVTAVLVMLLIVSLVRLAQAVVAGNIEDKELRYRTRKAFSLAGYVLMLASAIIIFSDQMTNLAVIIGALSVGIGFALREVIQGLIGWAVVSFGKLYKTGDRIQIGGVMGDVVDIGPLTTTLIECCAWVKSDLYNGRMVILSNSLILREHVFNYNADFPFLWDEIVIPVRTGSDHRLARDIIETTGKTVLAEIIEAEKESWSNFVHHNRVDEETLEPVVTMSFDANWIEFTLRYIVYPQIRRSTKDRLFSGILAGFEATSGKVQVASANMQLTEIPPLSLHLQKD